jgi:hydrogenase expression/formation protein HypC
MCWSVPGKITKITGNMGTVELSGIHKDIALDLIEDPKIGEYVLIHAGYAIEKVDEERAKYTIDFFDKQGDIEK